ncbi:hypothetical protein HQQ88_08465 [Curtobacterium sp. VKM Ac-2861]|uniref:hypothetical protein n=1 Tax=Curtobacterium sp. VKM Ac-2861 TaxID=2739016 RepID=UPI001565FED9|nr:hypothetical protein [Curtobacterium sp. VKM Ac-2861]
MLRKLTATRAVHHVGGLVRTLLHAPRTRKRSIAAATLGALALVGSLLVATPAQAINDTGTGGVFVPASGRVLDTKVGTGGFSTPMEAGKYRTIKIAGVAGIPDDGTVGAVSLNATVSGSADNGILYGRPDADTSRTTMLIYNDNAGEYVSNTAIVAVSAAGTIQVSTETAARLILDVQGYYTANTDGTAAGGFVPVAGKRIVDTRSGLGAPKALLAPGKSVDIQVTGANGVPAGASGAVVNLLPINSTASDGYLTPYATGTTRPDNALHYAPSVNTSIQAQVRLSSSGKMTIYNGSSTINLVIDLQGYFTKAGVTGATFTPGIGRVFDSRATGNTILAKNETRAIPVAGQAGVPVMGSGITAVVLTLTAAHGGSDGRASVWANGTTQPDTTSINFQTDEIRTNTVTVALGTNGKINLNNVADATNYVIDVQGWYTNPAAPTVTCDGAYTPGSWSSTYPANAISCHYSVAPAFRSDLQLVVSNNGIAVWGTSLDETASSTGDFLLDTTGGINLVSAAIVDETDAVVAESSFSFGLGDWGSADLTTMPEQGSLVNADDVTLSVAPTGDAFEGDTKFKYTVTANPDGLSTPIVESGWQADSWTVPSGQLEAGRTYYWNVVVEGKSGESRAQVHRESPLSTFNTDPTPVDTELTTSDGQVVTAPAGELNSTSAASSTSAKQSYEQEIYTSWTDKYGYRVYLRNGVYFNKIVAKHNGTLKIVQRATQYADSRGNPNATTYQYDTTFYKTYRGKIENIAHYRTIVNRNKDRIDGKPRGVVTGYCRQAGKAQYCPNWLKKAV